MTPFKQGELDGACGFYSIANALAVLIPNLKPELESIFAHMVKNIYLTNNDGSHFIDGLGRNRLNKILSDDAKIYFKKFSS
jgi:hypothetical protein